MRGLAPRVKNVRKTSASFGLCNKFMGLADFMMYENQVLAMPTV